MNHTLKAKAVVEKKKKKKYLLEDKGVTFFTTSPVYSPLEIINQ